MGCPQSHGSSEAKLGSLQPVFAQYQSTQSLFLQLDIAVYCVFVRIHRAGHGWDLCCDFVTKHV